MFDGHDDLPIKVTQWRNNIDALQRELESHMQYIKEKKIQHEGDIEIRNVKFRETLYKVLKRVGDDLKHLTGLLKTLAHIPRNCEFGTWDLVLQNLFEDLARISMYAIQRGPEDALELLEHVYEIRDSLLSQIIYAYLHKKIVLWMDLGIKTDEYVKGEILEATNKILDYANTHGYVPTKPDYIHPKSILDTNSPELSKKKSELPQLLPQLHSFTEAYQGIIELIENNFNLSSVLYI
jgi:hypothetical protein